MTDQRQRIIDSVFSRRNASGSIEESYVSHIKILEDSPETGGTKPRYILLSRTSTASQSIRGNVLQLYIFAETINGNGFLHKSKLNTNGTFSVGKTWRLPELRAVQVTSVRELFHEYRRSVLSFLRYNLSISPCPGPTDGGLRMQRIRSNF